MFEGFKIVPTKMIAIKNRMMLDVRFSDSYQNLLEKFGATRNFTGIYMHRIIMISPLKKVCVDPAGEKTNSGYKDRERGQWRKLTEVKNKHHGVRKPGGDENSDKGPVPTHLFILSAQTAN